MNLPNKLTIGRIILSFIFMLFLFSHTFIGKYLALFIFIIASLTDFYDGYIARRRNLVSSFGKLMDPVADKILTLSAFLAFVELKIIPAWMVILIISRELFITGIRLLAAGQGRVLAAEKAGKHKTVSQMVAIFSILTFLVVRDTIKQYFYFWNASWDDWFNLVVWVMMSVVVVLTLVSGISCIVQNRTLITNKD